MASNFNEINHENDGAFISVRFNDLLPENHPTKYIKKFVSTLDVTSFESKYHVGKGKKGRSPTGIRMMLGLILYAIYDRTYSAYQIDKASYTYADYWYFTHQKRISHDKISDFINIHKEDMKLVFSQTIILAEKNKLLSFDALYQDGYHIKANASLRQNCTSKELKLRRKKVKKRLNAVLTKIQSTDKDDDDITKKRKRYEDGLKTIDALHDELNEKINQRADKSTPSRRKELEESFQINTTDKDSEITKMKNGSYASAYTKINAIDGKADIIVATDVSGHYDESHKLCKLTIQANNNCQDLGKYKKVCADSNFNTLGSSVNMEAHGYKLIAPTKSHEKKRKNPEKYKKMITFKYDPKQHKVTCSEGNILEQTGQSVLRQYGSQTYIFSNEQGCLDCKRKKECTKTPFKEIRIDARQPVQQKVYRRYLQKEGRELYKKRMHVAEIFQADQKQNGKFTQVLRRGLEKVKTELMLHDITWNLRRIFRSAKAEIQWA